MTESEWLQADDPWPLLRADELTWSGRKKKLFCLACARRVWHLMSDERSRRAIEVAEAYINGCVGDKELKSAARDADDAIRGKRDRPGRLRRSAAYAALHAANLCQLGDTPSITVGLNIFAALKAAGADPHATENKAEARIQAELLRDIAGNPFRPVLANPGCRTPKVVDLAREIYIDRAFERLPLLADALATAGWAEERIIAHCQNGGHHDRGCWVVD